jgi:Tfp pilus assembly protein PilO
MATKPEKSDLKNLSIRELVIIVGTLLSAVGYGFYQFEYTVQTKKIKKLNEQSTETQASIGALQQVLISPARTQKTKAEIEKTQEEIVELQTAIEKTKARLTGQDLEILNELQNQADFYGVFLKSIKTSENNLSRAGLRLKEVSLVMEVESDYNALKKFLVSLKNLPAVITIQSLETTRNEKILPKLESRLHIKVIVL